MLIHSLFERIADKYSDHIAIEDNFSKINYRQLNEKVNQLARILRERGVQKDTIVVVLSPLNIELVSIMLAIYKSGGIYLPIDIDFSEKRLAQIFSKTFHGILVVDHEMKEAATDLVNRLNVDVDQLIVLDKSEEVKIFTDNAFLDAKEELNLSKYSTENPNYPIDIDDPNYIFYTSGSTGEGKAILGCHKSLTHYANWVIKEFQIDTNHRVGHLSQVTFDASLKDMFMALGSGATLCLPPAGTKNNFYKLMDWIESSRISIFQIVPSVFRLMIKSLSNSPNKKYNFPDLKHIMLDGEVMFAKDVMGWRSLVGDHAEIINLYGTTETTILDTFYRIKEVPSNQNAILHVGKPIDNTLIIIVNENRLCRIGETGEIYIKTPYLTKGYYNNQELTDQVFVQNPLVKDKKDIVYKTGDLGRYLKDRSIEVLGRKDNQVKINGIRIEIGEIERAVLGVKDINEVVVLVHKTDEHNDLVCYYTSPSLEVDDLKKELKKVLNQNVIPSYYVKMDKFPLNINGKIDKKALPLPEVIKPESAYEPPENEVEAKLEGIWKEMLNLKKISRKVSFFSIGGQSLKALQLTSKVYKEFEVDLRVKDIFKNPTIEDLGKLIQQSAKEKYDEIKKIKEQDFYDVSHAQKRMWLLAQMDEGSVGYHISNVYCLKGPLNIEALENSFKIVIQRHESLRTTFSLVQGILKQKIHSNVEFKLNIEDLSEVENKEEKALKIAEQVKNEVFNLEQWPLIRTKLVVLDNHEHLLMITMHHIVSDGWSMEIFFKELIVLYNSYLLNKENPLQPLKIHYKDYAAWHNSQLSNEKLKEHKQYWLNNLKGEITPIDLPTDYAKPKIKTYKGDQVVRIINGKIKENLIKIAKELDCTLYMVLLGAVKALLYRYTGQEDLIIGTPISGRSHEALNNQIGFFVNTLPLRTKIEGEKGIKNLLVSVKETTMNAYAHQVYPYDEIIQALETQGNTGGLELFNVMMTLQEVHTENHSEAVISDLNVYNYNVANKISKFDLTFTFKEIQDGLFVNLEYSTDLFSKSRIDRMLEHLEGLISGFLNNPDLPIDKVKFIGDEEEKFLLTEINNTQTFYPRSCSIQQLFEEQVQISPQSIAIVFEENKLTYKELNEKANQIAHFLINNYQIKPGDKIGLLMDRSSNLIIAILSILKSGAAYIPIEASYPKERKKYILSDTGVKVLICDSNNEENLDEFYQGEVFSFENQINLLGNNTINPVCTNQSSDLAYVMYTSGSTGIPKGVPVEHRSVVRLVKNTNYTTITPNHRIIQLSNHAFDGSVFDIFGALLNGGSLYCVHKDLLLNHEYLVDFISREKINMMFITTALFNSLVEMSPECVGNFDKIYFGGEEASLTHIRKALEHRKNRDSIVHVYGPTEGTTFSTYYPIIDLPEDSLSVPIGKMLSNTKGYVLDKNLELLPLGVPGEICISGDGLARGYLNNEELTSIKFVANPYGKGGERLYLTGDIGRWLPDGNLEFIGRKDNQVKIRGHRIELGEVENTLVKHEEIDQVYATTKGDQGGGKELVVYYTGLKALKIDVLKGFLSERLPHYMVPSYYVHLTHFPLTSNGKIDRKALPKVEEVGEGEKVYEAPINETERQLEKIWGEVLGRTEISRGENFFELGGHSLKAMQVVTRVYKDLGVKIELKDLFTHSSIKSLSSLIKSRGRVGYRAIVKQEEGSDYALSHAQKRLWVLSQFEESHLAYNMSGSYLLEGELDFSALERSFNTLIERHEILRTIFINQSGEPRQKVLKMDEVAFKIDYLDVSGDEEKAKAIAKAESLVAFNLETGPLLRAKVLRLDELQHVFIFTMHHIISDGWSMEVLLKEIHLLYNAYKLGKENPLEELPIQYKDYAAWQNEELRGDAQKEHRSYWMNQLSGPLPLLELPTDYRRPAIKTYNGSHVGFVIEKSVLEGLKALSQRQGASLFMTLLASVKALFYRYTGQEDIIIGTPVAGRDHLQLEDQIGFYINTLALRSRFNGGEDFTSLLEKVKTVTLEGYSHQQYPFEQMVEELEVKRDLSRSAVFDVMVILQNVEDHKGELSGIETGGYFHQGQSSKFDLTISFKETGNGLYVDMEYNTDLYKEQRIERMGEHLTGLVKSVIQQEATPLNKIKYLSEQEEIRLLKVLNPEHVIYDREPGLHVLIEEQAQKSPEAVAVVFENRAVTYRELNERSNQLAHYLRSTYSIKPEDVVGLMTDRSEEMIINLLGILKSSAGYVAIDPNYPEERINYMLKESKMKVVITNEKYSKYLSEETAVLYQEEQQALTSNYPKENPGLVNKETDLAYLIYTSGSTGVPKGIEISHKSVVSFLHWSQQEFAQSPYEVAYAVTSYCFDLSVYEMFYPLTVGKKVRVLDSGMEIKDYLDKEEGILINTVPSVIEELLREGAAFSRVTVLNMAGEPIPMSVKDQLDYERIEVRNLYGPSEDTTYSSCYRFIAEDELIPIGKPVGNTRFYILDEELELVPEGIAGELCISGEGLSRGYYKREDLTREKFVANPYEPGERMYRTGDLCRWGANEHVEYLGRKDHQVKVRGFRIELGEIESVLLKYPGVEKVVAVAQENPLGEKELVGYYMREEAIERGELRNYLSKHLPHYMVPSYYVHLTHFPLTSNGKIDRKALPKVKEVGEGEKVYEAPINETERQLAKIWGEVLGRTEISRGENFFELGGHSLKAMQVVTRVYKDLGVKIELKDLFTHSSIKSLSSLIKSRGRVGYRAIVKQEEGSDYALSHAQKRLWVLSQFEESHLAYNMSGSYLLEGELDFSALERSFNTLIERHEILRTIFINQSGEPRQKVLKMDEVAFKIDYLDVSGDEEKAKAIAKAESLVAFNLETGPLLRAKVLRLDELQHVFIFTMHHIISDGWSMEVLLKETHLLYNAYKLGKENPLEELPIQYKDYAAWQNEELRGDAQKEHRSYWMNQLSGPLPLLELPTDYRRPAIKTYNGSHVGFVIEKSVLEGLKALSQRQGASLFMTLLASVKALFYRYTGQEDIIIGTPVAGRDHLQLEDQIGFYINTLALRTEFDRREGFVELLQRVKENTFSAFNHQIYPFDLLVDELKVKRDTSRSPICDVILVLQNIELENHAQNKMEGVNISFFDPAVTICTVDLRLEFEERKDQLFGSINYDTDLFNKETIVKMTENLTHLLTEIVRKEDLKLYEISLKMEDPSETETIEVSTNFNF